MKKKKDVPAKCKRRIFLMVDWCHLEKAQAKLLALVI